MNYVLYADFGEGFTAYASFTDGGEFIGDAKRAAAAKKAAGQTAENRNAAEVFGAFVAEAAAVRSEELSLLMRALRHFDEVGLSNELYDALEALCEEENVRAAAFAPADRQTSAFALREFSGFEI